MDVSQVADELGFLYQETASFNVLGWPDSFELTKRAHAGEQVIDGHLGKNSMIGRFASMAIPKSRNVMTCVLDSAKVALFDFEYTKNDIECSKAVAAVASPKLDHPYFRLIPANTWDHLADRFRTFKVLVGKHKVIGEPNLIPSAVTAIALELNSRATLEVGDSFLLMYNKGDRSLEQCDISELVSEVRRVYTSVCDNVTSSRQSTPDST